jgi:2-methylcitrate dehydratase PrpD
VRLHEGRVYLEQCDAAHLHNPAILETARRVIPRPDAEFGRIFETTDKAPTHLEVALKSGARYHLRVDYPGGCPQHPATPAELAAKFDALASPVLPAVQVAQFKASLFALESGPHIDELIRQLCPPRLPQGSRD